MKLDQVAPPAADIDKTPALASLSEKCADCKGLGRTIVEQPSKLYKCGFITVAQICPACFGFGRVVAMPADNKVAAAGGAK
jgi:DnaJ-class molecular chaperone